MNFGSRTSLPDSKILEYAEQYNHRLLSLEADLKDLAKGGLLTPREFSKRIRKLRDLQSLHETIKSVVATKRGLTSQSDLNLPLLEHASPAEKKICIQFFERRERWARRLKARLEGLNSWLQSTISGRSNFISNTLRLSKVNKMLRETDHQVALYQQELKSVDYHVEKILEQMPKSMTGLSGAGEADLLKALAQVFSRLDQTVSRVARLKSSIKAEEGRLAEMRHWLRRKEREMDARAPVLTAPTPLETASALRELQHHLGITVDQSEQRLTLAKEFWEKVLRQDRVEEEDSSFLETLHAKSQRLNKRQKKAERRRGRKRALSESSLDSMEDDFAPS